MSKTTWGRVYNSTGQLVYEAEEKPSGTIRGYHIQGGISFEIIYKEDSDRSIRREYNVHGLLMIEEQQKDNTRHGMRRGYRPNGKLHYETYYVYDNKVTKEEWGEWRDYQSTIGMMGVLEDE